MSITADNKVSNRRS